MDDEARKTLNNIIGTHSSIDLVDQFKKLLVGAGVALKTPHKGKYFLASREGRTVFLLAHESSSQGFWGVLRTHVEELQKTTTDQGLTGWGAVLLDASPKRGFWVKGSDIDRLYEKGVLQFSKNNGQYLFLGKELRKIPGLSHYFIGIQDFLESSGLLERESRIEL
jgi:hypothetical protein